MRNTPADEILADAYDRIGQMGGDPDPQLSLLAGFYTALARDVIPPEIFWEANRRAIAKYPPNEGIDHRWWYYFVGEVALIREGCQ